VDALSLIHPTHLSLSDFHGNANIAFFNTLPDYKDQSAQSKIVISARIAGIKVPWMELSLPSLALDPRSRRG